MKNFKRRKLYLRRGLYLLFHTKYRRIRDFFHYAKVIYTCFSMWDYIDNHASKKGISHWNEGKDLST